MNKGTIDKFLAEMMRKEKNALNIIMMYNDILSSKEDKLIIEYKQENGDVEQFEIPSIAYLQSSIKRLEKNFENLAQIGILQASILLPDGSKRAIITQNLPVEPIPVNLQSSITNKFYSKNCDVISKLVTPRTYISLNLSNFSDATFHKVLVNKLSPILDTKVKKDYYSSALKGKTYSYDDLLVLLKDHYIEYQENIDEVDIEPRIAKKSGYFDVLNITKKEVSNVAQNGTNVKSNKIYYHLNKLTYKNNQNDSDVNIKIGDEIIVSGVSNVKNTIYTVESVDYSKNTVCLIRIEGLDKIMIGVDKIMINPGYDERVFVNIPIASNEIFIPFIKSIQNTHKIVNKSWGSSMFITANDLSLYNDDTVKFYDYYEDNVDSLKEGLKNISENNSTPISKAIKPDSPTLSQSNFIVEMINSHKISTITATTKEKYAEKETIKSSITVLDESIKNLKDKLSVTQEAKEKEKINKEINEKYKQRKNLTSSFTSLVNDIITTLKDSSSFTPKYRLRGFFNIPAGKYEDEKIKNGLQEIIKFECEYRYLKKDGTEDSTKTMSYKDQFGNTIKASFTNWNQVLTLRQRVRSWNPATKTIEWEKEELLNPEIINVNQIDVPISANEAVEVRVRSISEVGYPNIMNYSDWSESAFIEFPKELQETIDSSIAKEISNDKLVTTIESELTSIGLYEHLTDSFTSGDKLFHHSAKNIATDYYTQENKQMSAAQVIDELKQKVESLQAEFAISDSKLEIFITDELGTVLANVSNNDEINIFAGYYKNMLKGDNSKGEIITKVYYVVIKNPKATNMELLSYVPGLYDNILPTSGGIYTDYVNNKYEYDSYRRYSKVPISYRGTLENETYFQHKSKIVNPFIELPQFMSSQVKGQYIYSRERDITLSNSLYIETMENNGHYLPSISALNPSNFCFGGFDASGNIIKGSLGDFSIHINHPDLKNVITKDKNIYNQTTFVPELSCNSEQTTYYNPLFSIAIPATYESGQKDYNKQLGYKNYNKQTSAATIENFQRKMGFSTNDKYLIGKKTCGSYLFLAPQMTKSLHVGSNIYNKGIILSNGEIRIPIVFQSRMSDYYGEGDAGTGKIGGDESKTNLFYSKKIGLDILPKNQDLFSFDLSVEMQYQQSI